ncbi:MAG: aminopeptidase [Ichthyobacteriaceae bacterium]|nr:aminopeptidase [Ichthyobacteriaceae bacterium]
MKKNIFYALLLSASLNTANAQNYGFKSVIDLDATEVKSQGRTGSCWSFSTTSFIESEILRIKGKSVDLSEMYNVRMVYPEKAKNFIGRQGKAQFSEGSLNHDVMKVIADYGIVTEDFYSAKIVDKNRYDHAELATILEAYLVAVNKKKGGELSTVWLNGFEAVLNAYMGNIPKNIKFEGKNYTPIKLRDALGIDASNYVEITSFNKYPYYSTPILDIPDNWANGAYYNMPINDLQSLVIDALNKGYTVAIDADVSEKTFSSTDGMAIIPKADLKDLSNNEISKMLTDKPVEEMKITENFRQAEFNNLNTTDDHLMHITGMLEDKNGTKYFKVKNSWGTENRGNDGYIYMSEAYFKLKTISVMLHKDAIDKKTKNKLKIK